MCPKRVKPTFEQVILNSVLSTTPPAVPLYHYTKQRGLLGIVQDRVIWAIHHQCLNDRQEYLHAKELVRREIKQRLTAANPNERPVLDEMLSALDLPGNEDVNLYVASFSEQSDSLSQWRAYGAPTSGFALGFRCDRLALPDRFNLVRCIYDPPEQHRIVGAIVSEVLKRSVLPDGLFSAASFHLRFILHTLALTLKDPKFDEEREWRIISPVLMDFAPAFPIKEETELKFRPGQSLLTPYRTIPLKNDRNEFPLIEVVVGPNPSPEQAHRSVQSLLNSQPGLKAVAVRDSDIPYRNW